jgi:hypothetical protein
MRHRESQAGDTSFEVISGTLTTRLRIRWARQRWRAAHGKQISIALMIPGAPSEVTSSGSLSPRRFMSSKNAVTNLTSSSFAEAVERRPSINALSSSRVRREAGKVARRANFHG